MPVTVKTDMEKKKGEVKHQPVKVSIFTENNVFIYLFIIANSCQHTSWGPAEFIWFSFPARQVNEYCLSRHLKTFLTVGLK